MGGYDLYRLRQIVEFGFANALLALALIPLVPIINSVENAVRIIATIAMAVFAVHVIVLVRRRNLLSPAIRLPLAVILVDLLVVGLTASAVAFATLPAWEAALLALLARPMVAFLLVLSTLRAEAD